MGEKWAVLLFALLLAFLVGAAIQYGEALLVLSDIAHLNEKTLYKRLTKEPTFHAIEQGGHPIDLYLPGSGTAKAALILIPGLAADAARDERLVALAKTFCRADFAVIVPTLTALGSLKTRPSDIKELCGIIDFGHSLFSKKTGIISFSYATGLAVLASIEERTRDKVGFIIAIGGYYDLKETIGYFTTGYFNEGGQSLYLEPSPYGKFAFAVSFLEYLPLPDQKIFAKMIQTRVKNKKADLGPLAKKLTSEGFSFYSLLENKDPEKTDGLLEKIPLAIQNDIDALTLRGKNLTRIKAKLYLLHGKNDSVIPYGQSVELHQAIAGSRLFLVQSITHVEPKAWDYLSWEFFAKDLADFWKMQDLVTALLQERERQI